MRYNTFEKNSRVDWVACDTETYTYIDGVKVTTEQLEELGREKPQSYFRQHARVDAYAWLFSDGVHFAICENFAEYCAFCCEHNVKAVWWYNAKFDFAQIDYAILSGENGAPVWTIYDGDKGQPFQYSSLHNDTGARYSLKLWYLYKGSGRGANRREHVHAWSNYDFCNIFGGGLAAVLKNLNVVDFDGVAIRKLTMDYQGEINEQAIKYMEVDAKGLYHAIRIADEFLYKNFGYKIAGKKPDVMTAGGLAKKVMLKFLFHKEKDLYNVQAFQRLFKMDGEIDAYMREHNLYRGGITFLNQRYANKLYNGLFYRYDINSMYPAQMAEMAALVGRPVCFNVSQWNKLSEEEKAKYEVIYELESYCVYMRENMLPIWYDFNKREYTGYCHLTPSEKTQLIFKDEFDEMLKWFEIDYKISRLICFEKIQLAGFKEFVNFAYEFKTRGKRENNAVMKMFAKLLLNSAYGKLAERVKRAETHREINKETGCVHLVYDNMETDESGILSVVQGAKITSMARISLLQKIRQTCENPAKDFIYCDTDSIHVLQEYPNANDFKLGELKLEAVCNCGKWLAPKTYFEIATNGEFEPHTKGVPIKVIMQELKQDKNKDLKEYNIKDLKDIKEIDAMFAAGVKFQALAGMNIKGGKALIPVLKYLCAPTNETNGFNAGGELELFMKNE